jgi:hypothetical protein
VAHPVDLLVDRGFLLDERVGARDVGLGLVIVVVGDEVLDRIVGEEGLELPVELRGERLVGRQDQGRALRLLDDLGHREGLARAGDAEQHLVALQGLNAADELGDGPGLVAGRREVGFEREPDAALGFLRPFRTVRRPGLAVLEQRVALGEQPLQRRHRRRGAAVAAGIRQVGALRRGAVLRRRQAEGLGQTRVDIGRVAERVAGLRGLREAVAGDLRPPGRGLAGAGLRPGLRGAGLGCARPRGLLRRHLRRRRPVAVQRRVQQLGQIGIEGLQLGLRRLGGRGRDGSGARFLRSGHRNNMGPGCVSRNPFRRGDLPLSPAARPSRRASGAGMRRPISHVRMRAEYSCQADFTSIPGRPSVRC